MMTRKQIEEFAVGYSFPTEYVEIILKKYDFDKERVHQILCKSCDEVVKEVQDYSVQLHGCDCCQGDEALYWKDDENNSFVDSNGRIFVTVKGMPMRFKVKCCPNCGKKF